MTKRSPGPAVVRAALPLSATRPADPLSACNVCGKTSDSLAAWREHDEWDKPIAGIEHLVYIGKDHPSCLKAMDKHPRLYDEARGEPGAFPRLCGPCRFRGGLRCQHPDLKANGGPGLLVHLEDPLHGAIVCGSRGRIRVINRALKCAGREVQP